jgi:hypothetical protein
MMHEQPTCSRCGTPPYEPLADDVEEPSSPPIGYDALNYKQWMCRNGHQMFSRYRHKREATGPNRGHIYLVKKLA